MGKLVVEVQYPHYYQVVTDERFNRSCLKLNITVVHKCIEFQIFSIRLFAMRSKYWCQNLQSKRLISQLDNQFGKTLSPVAPQAKFQSSLWGATIGAVSYEVVHAAVEILLMGPVKAQTIIWDLFQYFLFFRKKEKGEHYNNRSKRWQQTEALTNN